MKNKACFVMGALFFFSAFSISGCVEEGGGRRDIIVRPSLKYEIILAMYAVYNPEEYTIASERINNPYYWAVETRESLPKDLVNQLEVLFTRYRGAPYDLTLLMGGCDRDDIEGITEYLRNLDSMEKGKFECLNFPITTDGLAKLIEDFWENCFEEKWNEIYPILYEHSKEIERSLPEVNIHNFMEEWYGREFKEKRAWIYSPTYFSCYIERFPGVIEGGSVAIEKGGFVMIDYYKSFSTEDVERFVKYCIHEWGHDLVDRNTRQKVWYEKDEIREALEELKDDPRVYSTDPYGWYPGYLTMEEHLVEAMACYLMVQLGIWSAEEAKENMYLPDHSQISFRYDLYDALIKGYENYRDIDEFLAGWLRSLEGEK